MPLQLFIARFETDPRNVTTILGIEPTSVVRKGDVLPSGGTSRINSWAVEAGPERLTNGSDHEDALRQILHLLEGRKDRFARLRDEDRPQRIVVWGELRIGSEVEGLWLDPDQMKLMSECEVGWGFDVFAP
jgi:hypothetical protein